MFSCFSNNSFHLIYVGFREHGDMAPDGSMQVWQPSSHVQTKFMVLPDSTFIKNGKRRSVLVSFHCHLPSGHFALPLKDACWPPVATIINGVPLWRSKLVLALQASVSSRTSLCDQSSLHALFEALQISLRTTSAGQRFQWPFLIRRLLILSADACTPNPRAVEQWYLDANGISEQTANRKGWGRKTSRRDLHQEDGQGDLDPFCKKFLWRSANNPRVSSVLKWP